eukprot:5735152-Lingulodinium_polyedra.AAC.1
MFSPRESQNTGFACTKNHVYKHSRFSETRALSTPGPSCHRRSRRSSATSPSWRWWPCGRGL